MRKDIQFISSKTLLAVLALTAALALTVSGAVLAESGEEATEAAPPNLPTDEEIAELYDGDGMKIPLDGTSLENFNASMELIKKHSTASSYKSLENAIQYLLIYDLEVRRDKEALAAKLNGVDGYDVKSRVGWRKPPPAKSKAVKGSSDANLIDS